MKKMVAEYLREQEQNMQTAIESRTAQKLFDDVFTREVIYDLMTEFVAYPQLLRTATEEEQVDEVRDYFIGMFFEQYAMSYIEQYKATRKELGL